MDFKTAAKLGSALARDYAEDVFDLLANYQDISASEAASRLNLHIRTAQDYLDSLAELGIVSKTEVHEAKRPYNRYSLATPHIRLDIDLSKVRRSPPAGELTRRVRERKDSGVRFATARSGEAIQRVSIWRGDGREGSERTVNLTAAQGQFLFHLPFPNAEPLAIGEIMRRAGVDPEYAPEVMDIVEWLYGHGAIEVQ